MSRFIPSLTVLAALLGGATASHAQAWPAGSVGADKTIYAKVYINVGDALARPMPIGQVRMLLVSATNDSVRLATDAAGAAAAYVKRGEYRLVTLDWVSSAGKDYKWNMPLVVAPGMHDVVLTSQNAATAPKLVVAESPAELAPPSAVKTEVTVAPAPAPSYSSSGRRQIVDSSGFAWDVFESSFARGAVWGTALNLPSVEVALVFNRDSETRQLDHFPANWRSLPNDKLAAFLAQARRTRP